MTDHAQPEDTLSDEDIFAGIPDDGEEPEVEETAEQEAKAPDADSGDAEEQSTAGEAEKPEDAEKSEEQNDDAGQDDIPDWYKNLSDEARQLFDANTSELGDLRSRYNALHGRLAPVQRQNEQLRRQLNDLQTQQPRQAQQPTPQDLDGNKAFEQFKKDFPEEAAAMQAQFAIRDRQAQEQQQRLNALEQRYSDLGSSQTEIAMEQSRRELEEAYPDYLYAIGSQEYAEWLQHQPVAIQDMAVSSTNPQDAIYILDQFGSYIDQQVSLNQQAQRVAQSREQGEKAQQINERRAQKLQDTSPAPQTSTVSQPGGGGSVQSEEDFFASIPDDPIL